jgi:hypothetical protein
MFRAKNEKYSPCFHIVVVRRTKSTTTIREPREYELHCVLIVSVCVWARQNITQALTRLYTTYFIKFD